ncbi:MAG: zinc ribbon domain-containing protein [Blastocatellia bacterium]
MPIYEYVCEKCGHHLEIMQKMTDEPLARCPKCGKKALEKIFSQTSFQLKGGGWYVSDYGKSGGGKKDSSSESKESKDKKEPAAAA